ncbi:hypothetical protein MTO96_042819 [Rhipicephalus appendiculatus]
MTTLDTIAERTTATSANTIDLSLYQDPIPFLNSSFTEYLFWTSMPALFMQKVKCVLSTYIGPGRKSDRFRRTLKYIPITPSNSKVVERC